METSFAVVAEPNRRAILSLLLSSERSVGELERELRLSQPSVSKHLDALERHLEKMENVKNVKKVERLPWKVHPAKGKKGHEQP